MGPKKSHTSIYQGEIISVLACSRNPDDSVSAVIDPRFMS